MPAANAWPRLIANAATGVQRAAMLTQRLLAFAWRQPLDLQPTNVSRSIGGMSDFFRRTLGENIDLHIVAGADLWQVEVDPSQMEAAILNLGSTPRMRWPARASRRSKPATPLSMRATPSRTPMSGSDNMSRYR